MRLFVLRLFFFLISCFTFKIVLWAQPCNVVPVKEAIVNGNFESGNTGFLTEYVNISTNASFLARAAAKDLGNQYYSNSGEYVVYNQGTTATGKAYNYFNGDFDDDGLGLYDHTKKDSSGKYMLLDGITSGVSTMWQENVPVYANQVYYFSAWIASLANSAPPQLVFEVKGNMDATWTQLNTTPLIPTGIRVWNQFYKTWNSGLNTSCQIRLRNYETATTGNDLALDDISFINGCQNTSTGSQPVLPASISLCLNNGSITINPGLSTSTAGPDRRFYWYSGTGVPQTELINASQTQNTYTVNTMGTYRVCVTEDGGCGKSATVVIDNQLKLALSDLMLCSPAVATLDVGITAPGYSYVWSVPAGATNPGNSKTATANISGAYKVTATGPSGPSYICIGSATSNVTSNLPTYDATKIATAFCQGTTQTITGLGTGANAANYKWYTAATGGTVAGSGANPSFTFPGSGTTFTVYLEDGTTYPLTGSPLVAQSLGAWGANTNTSIFFSVLKTIQIQTVTVKQQTWSGSCGGSGTAAVVVDLLQGATVVKTVNGTVTCGNESILTLNFTISPGSYQLKLKGGSGNNGMVIASTGYSFSPSSIANWINITNSDNAGFNGPFANINIVKSNSCDRIPVNIPLKSCCTNIKPTLPAAFSVCQQNAINITLGSYAGTSPTFHWKGPNGFSKDTTALTVKVTTAATASMQGWYVVYATTAACSTPSPSDSVYITVNQPPSPAVSTNKSAICKGQTTATLSVTGCSGCTYNWSNSLGTTVAVTVNPTTATTYTLTYTGSNTCSASSTVAVGVNIPVVIDATTDKPSICKGQTSTNLNVTGCTGCTSFVWSSSAGNTAAVTVSPTSNTTYTVSVVDANTCTASDNIAVSVNTPVTIDATTDKTAICQGQTSANLNVTGCAGCTSFAWNNSAGNTAAVTVSPAATTIYTVTVVDANTCTASDNVTVTVNTPVVIDATSDKPSICKGQTSANLNVTGCTGCTSFNWSNSAGSTAAVTVSPTTNITYTVTVIDANTCSATDNIAVSVNIPVVITATIDKPEICKGQANATLNVTGCTGCTSFVWSNSTGNTASVTVSPTTNTTYTVTVVDANTCTASSSIGLGVNTPPVPDAGANQRICRLMSVQPTSTTDPTWTCKWTSSLPEGHISNKNTCIPSFTVADSTNLLADKVINYTLDVTDSKGCKGSDNMNVTFEFNCKPFIQLSATKDTICRNQSSVITAVVKSDKGVKSYQWSDPSFLTQNGPFTVTPAFTTTYMLTVTDNDDKSNADTLVVVVNQLPVADAGLDQEKCYGQKAMLTANAGFKSYNWTTTETTQQITTPVITQTTAFTVTVTDLHGCTDDASVAVVMNPLPVLTFGAIADQCVDVTALTLNTGSGTPAGGTEVYKGTAVTGNVFNPNAAGKGTYTIKYIYTEPLKGCTDSTTQTVTVQPLPVITLTAAEICRNQTATVDAGDATRSYVWSDIPPTTVHQLSVVPTITTNYTVTVTDSHNCSDKATVTVTVNQLPVAMITGTTPICENDKTTLNATGAGVGGNYKWGPDNQSTASITVNPVVGNTTFTVTVTDVHTCTDDTTIVITVNPLPTITCGALPDRCVNSATITLTACSGSPAGGTGTYSGNGVTGTTFDPASAGQGTHTITYTYTDLNNCTQTGTTPITVLVKPNKPIISPSSITICDKESTTLQAIGGMSKYKWDDSTTFQSITKQPPQVGQYSYSVTVTNSGGCTESDLATITVNPIPDVQFVSDKTAGCEPLPIVFNTQQTTPAGGQFHWNFGVSQADSTSNEPNPVFTFQKAGVYNVSVLVTTPPHCKAMKKITQMITVYKVPTAGFTYSPSTPTTFKPDVIFNDQSTTDVVSREWNFADTLSPDNTATNRRKVTHTFTGHGNYPVQLIVKNAECTDTVLVNVYVKPEYTFYAPNAFTPNDDGLNDWFIPKGVGIDPTNFNMYVFDRWGEKVFETSDMNKPWDGKTPNNKTLCPDGVYAWVVTFKDMEGKAHRVVGNVTLLK